MQKLHTQDEWIARAKAVLPAAGFGNFDPEIIISHGTGSRVWDEDGREYVDYLIGSGPMLLGHGHVEVMEAVLEQLPKGMTFFANNTKGIELAEAITQAVPCCEQVRFVTSSVVQRALNHDDLVGLDQVSLLDKFGWPLDAANGALGIFEVKHHVTGRPGGVLGVLEIILFD